MKTLENKALMRIYRIDLSLSKRGYRANQQYSMKFRTAYE